MASDNTTFMVMAAIASHAIKLQPLAVSVVKPSTIRKKYTTTLNLY
jgi:hypothetical protein